MYSIILYTDAVNTFVDVTVDVQHTTLNCLFTKVYMYISCFVKYGNILTTCDEMESRKHDESVTDLHIPLYNISPSVQYCYIVTAGNGTHRVKIQGVFRGRIYIALN